MMEKKRGKRVEFVFTEKENTKIHAKLLFFLLPPVLCFLQLDNKITRAVVEGGWGRKKATEKLSCSHSLCKYV